MYRWAIHICGWEICSDGDGFLDTTGRTMLGDVGREVQTDEEGDVSYMQMTSMMALGVY